jgi:hypothetical protein
MHTIFLNSLFWSKCNKLVSKDVTIFGNFLVSKNHNEPTKSSLLLKRSPNLVTLVVTLNIVAPKAIPSEASRPGWSGCTGSWRSGVPQPEPLSRPDCGNVIKLFSGQCNNPFTVVAMLVGEQVAMGKHPCLLIFL